MPRSNRLQDLGVSPLGMHSQDCRRKLQGKIGAWIVHATAMRVQCLVRVE